MSEKTPKEIAFLREHYVAPEYTERFAALVDEKLELPVENRFLYVEAGTGSHALAVRERLDPKVEFVGTDTSEEALKIARAKTAAVESDGEFTFLPVPPTDLDFAADEFAAAVCDATFIPREQLDAVLEELVRVVKTNGIVGFYLPTASSFGEFFSIFWEMLYNVDALEHSAAVEKLINSLPTVSDAEEMAREAGLKRVEATTKVELIDFKSGKVFANSPLVGEFLLPVWLRDLPGDVREKVTGQLAEAIDRARDDLTFQLSIKATFVTGTKA